VLTAIGHVTDQFAAKLPDQFLSRKVHDLPGALFFPGTRSSQVEVGSSRLCCHGLSVSFQRRRMFGQEGFQVAELDTFRVQELRHGTAGHDRQVTAKQHAIRAGEYACDLGLMFLNKGLQCRYLAPGNTLQ
jgi:hypothetical protein